MASSDIVERLLASAKSDPAGIYWDIFGHARLPGDTAALAISVQTGVTGIVLFLSEYLRITGDHRVREAIVGAIEWCDSMSCKANVRPGVYYGYPGYLYTRQYAANILASQIGPIDVSTAVRSLLEQLSRADCSLAHGIAGNIVALLSLNPESHRGLLPETTQLAYLALLKQTAVAEKGYYWCHYPHCVRPPLGYVHGNSGVAYLWGQIASQFGSGWAREIRDSAHAYINSQFSARHRNWPDFMANHNEQRNSRILEFVAGGSDTSGMRPSYSDLSWAEGAAGILLSRIASELNFTQQYSNDALALELIKQKWRTTNHLKADFSIARGWGGIALSLRALGLKQQHTELDALWREIADAAVEQNQKLGHFYVPQSNESLADHGLFEGLAGIGYFLLTASDSDGGSDPLLLPWAPCSSNILNGSREQCHQLVLESHVPALAKICEGALDEDRSSMQAAAVHALISELRKNISEPVSNRVSLDLIKSKASAGVVNARYISLQKHRRSALYKSRYARLSGASLLSEKLILGSEIQLGALKLTDKSESERAPTEFVLLDFTCNGYVEYKLPALAYVVLGAFRTANTGISVIKAIRRKYTKYSATPVSEIDSQVQHLINESLRAGFLERKPGFRVQISTALMRPY